MKVRISRYWLCQIVGWTSLVIISFLIAFTLGKADMAFLISLACSSLVGLFVSHLMRYHISKIGLLSKTLTVQIVGFILLSLLYSFIFGALVEFVDYYLLQYQPQSAQIYSRAERLFLSSFNCLWILMIWALLYYVYHYIQRNRSHELDTLMLEATVKSLQLKTIKSHINPHFIFNALNSIRALVDENPERARKAITELSNILRSSLTTEQQETVPLSDELDIVKDYMALEQMRFEERLRIILDIDPDTLQQNVPPMMLQTLVENAIKHGVSKHINGGFVRIKSHFVGDNHELIVENSGKLHEFSVAHKMGFGIKSTEERLNLLYQGKAGFEIKNTGDNLVSSKVTMPVDIAAKINYIK